MALNENLATYLDGLEALVDGRGYNAKQDAARIFVETACDSHADFSKLINKLAYTGESLHNLVAEARYILEKHVPIAADLAKEYESYFDDMEKANRLPLAFHAWKLQEGK